MASQTPGWVKAIRKQYRRTAGTTVFFRKPQNIPTEKLVNLVGETIAFGLINRLDPDSVNTDRLRALRYICGEFCDEYDTVQKHRKHAG